MVSGHTLLSVGRARVRALTLTSRTARMAARGPDGWTVAAQDRIFEVLALPLAGAFQASNALVAAGLCVAAGEPVEAVMDALEHLRRRAGPPAARIGAGPARRRGLYRLRPYAGRAGDGAHRPAPPCARAG